MEAVSYIILIGSTLLIVSVLTSYLALRVGAPLLLIFLGIGLLAGEDGIGHISFNDAGSAFLIGSMALAVILFESGFDTKLASYKAAAWPAMTLATVGVAVTTGVVGIAAHYLMGLAWGRLCWSGRRAAPPTRRRSSSCCASAASRCATASAPPWKSNWAATTRSPSW